MLWTIQVRTTACSNDGTRLTRLRAVVVAVGVGVVAAAFAVALSTPSE